MSEQAFHNSNASFADIHKQYDGNWAAALTQFGIDATLLDGRRHQCPRAGCASKDGFRFDDREGRGTWICSQGIGAPVAGDGPALLVHAQVARDSTDALKPLSGVLLQRRRKRAQ
jgi:putative DNA primase/helicase